MQSNPNADTSISISAPAIQSDTEFQRFITDINPLKLAFYSVFAGWQVINVPTTIEFKGQQIKQDNLTYVRGSFALMNESGADYLFGAVYPLISQLASTSQLDDAEIRHLWRGRLRLIAQALRDNYFLQNNTWEVKIEFIGDIIATLGSLYVITKKAGKGFTLKELAESFTTATIRKEGVAVQQPTMLDNIKKKLGIS